MLVLVPKFSKNVAAVALVLSVWTTTRKPKLATTTVSFEHTVAVRIAVLEKKSVGGDHPGCAQMSQLCGSFVHSPL